MTLFGCLIDKKRSCFGLSARWPTETMLIWPSKKDYMYLFLIVTNNLLVKPRSLGKSEYFDPLFCDSYVYHGVLNLTSFVALDFKFSSDEARMI